MYALERAQIQKDSEQHTYSQRASESVVPALDLMFGGTKCEFGPSQCSSASLASALMLYAIVSELGTVHMPAQLK